MLTFRLRFTSLPLIVFTLLSLSLTSCDRQTGISQKNENNSQLAGTWIIKSRIVDGAELPADQRQIRFVFEPSGLFKANYRGEQIQDWIRAGDGSFSYDPPILTLYWDSGATATLLVVEAESDRLVLHHGRNLVPLVNQDPTEIFTRQIIEKGPVRKPS